MVYDDLRLKFDRDGYVVINDFLSEKEVEELRNAGEELAANESEDTKNVFKISATEKLSKYFLESADKISYFYEKNALDEKGDLVVDLSSSLNKVGHALHKLHPVFEACTFSDKVKRVCRELGLVKPVVPQSMYIYKHAKIGGEVVEHQDSTYLFTTPDSLVGFWMALDDATLENGCLWMIPGSHKFDLHKRMVCNPNDYSILFQGMVPKYEQSLYVPVAVEKSSLVLIHGRVIHKSESNKSKYPRHAYTFHVFDEGVSSYSEQNWLQSKFEFKTLY